MDEFGLFWDSEAPRIGDDKAVGWKHSLQFDQVCRKFIKIKYHLIVFGKKQEKAAAEYVESNQFQQNNDNNNNNNNNDNNNDMLIDSKPLGPQPDEQTMINVHTRRKAAAW